MNAILDAALEYGRLGWPVVPLWWPLRDGRCSCPQAVCDSPGKHPHSRLAPNGLTNASTDVDVIRRWWEQCPDLNVGLCTGIAFDVLDIDNEAAGVWLAHYALSRGADTETCWGWGPLSLTGKGSHLLYRPTGAGNRGAIEKQRGLDWRGRGGYIVAPPSRHYLGGTYRWHELCPPSAPILPAPDFLVQLVAGRSSMPPASPAARRASDAARERGGWSPSGLVARVTDAVEGERNNVLNWAAGRVGDDVRAGRVDTATALQALDELAAAAERVGLNGGEVDKTIRSGYSAGLAGRVAA